MPHGDEDSKMMSDDPEKVPDPQFPASEIEQVLMAHAASLLPKNKSHVENVADGLTVCNGAPER